MQRFFDQRHGLDFGLLRFYRDQSGATAIEYALIASLLSIVIITAVALLGGSVAGMWAFISNSVDAKLDGIE